MADEGDYYEDNVEDEDDFSANMTEEDIDRLERAVGNRNVIEITGKRREMFGIGTTISQVLSEDITPSARSLRDNNPFLQSSFLPPIACTGCGKRLDFLYAYSLLRSGKKLEDVYTMITAKMICCRATIIEDPNAVEIMKIVSDQEFQDSPEKLVYQIEDEIVASSRRVVEIEKRISASQLTPENERTLQLLRFQLEEEAKKVEHLYLDLEEAGKHIKNDGVKRRSDDPYNQPDSLFKFLEKFSTTKKLDLPGLKDLFFDYDGFISFKHTGVKREEYFEEEIEEEEEEQYDEIEENIEYVEYEEEPQKSNERNDEDILNELLSF